jgi:aryl-alcohol dehydrogenase-like predicted oxidoreductase
VALSAQIEASLRRLRTDTIDLYYLHRVDPDTPLEESLATIAAYRDRGQIRHVGLSEVGIEQLEHGRQIVPISAVQNRYNLAERTHDEVVDHCAEQRIAFVPFFPLRGADTPTVAEIAGRHGASPQQVALAWLLARSPAMLPIPGTLSLDHLEQNLAALDLELSNDELDILSRTDAPDV